MPRILIAFLFWIIASPAFAYPVTIDSCNRSLTFEHPPQRAVSNDINITEMMLVLGLQANMVGYSGISDKGLIRPDFQSSLTNLQQLSPEYATLEDLLGVDADFYFAGWNYGLQVNGDVTPRRLEQLGIQVYELTESCIHLGPKPEITLEEMYKDLITLGRIFGIDDRAKSLVQEYRDEVATLPATPAINEEPLRVFVYDSGEESPFTAGRYAMPNALIKAAGGRNIFDDLEKSWTTVGWEGVIERNPEIIIIVNYGQVSAEQKRQFMLTHPAFQDIDAVRNDRFVVLEYNEATPGPRNIEALKKLATSFWNPS